MSNVIESFYNGGGENASGYTTQSPHKFGDPFLLPSWSILPTDLRSLFDCCRYLYVKTPEYAQAALRTNAYFVTDIEFIGGAGKSGDKREQLEHRSFLMEQLGMKNAQMELGMDESCYGNAFGRIFLPFNRFLLVPTENGTAEISLASLKDVKYLSSQVKYEIEDPTRSHRTAKHRRRIAVDFVDRKSRDVERISLRRIDPAYAHLQYADRSGRCQVIERFQPQFISSITQGHLWQVNETPIGQLRAIAAGDDYLYNFGEVFHLKRPHISGISNGGWGIPNILLNYTNVHQLAVYRKIDEAIGLDFMLPFRIFFPKTGSGGDLTSFANAGSMGVWKGMLEQMVKNRRADPMAMHAQPFELGYQEVGANGKSLTPKDNMQWQTDALLNSAGFPGELYRGALTVQQMPATLRMFENHWQYLPWSFNRYMQWVSKTVRDHQTLERIDVRMTAPNMIDDMEARHVMLQLASGGEFPRRKALRSWGGDDPVEDAAERALEDVEIKRRVMKIQEDAAREEGQGSMFSGGAGGSPAGVGYTPTQQAERAEAEAKRLLQIQFVGDRQKQLSMLRAQDQGLYALVKQKMDEMRSAARSQGGAQVAEMASA